MLYEIPILCKPVFIPRFHSFSQYHLKEHILQIFFISQSNALLYSMEVLNQNSFNGKDVTITLE